MSGARPMRLIVPDGIDDPRRVSGGNVYDRHVRDGLAPHGWRVETVEVADAAAAASALRSTPDDARVLVDGLVARWAPDGVEEAARRARLVVLAHMLTAAFPDATDAAVDAERRALAAARGVVVTSRWTADELVRRGLADARRVVVAAPGVDMADGVAAPRDDEALLCVGVIAPHKGQDTLLAALARLPRFRGTCTLVGATDTYPAFASAVARDAAAFGGRVRLTGALDRRELEAAYRSSALLVAPSRVESAGMAIAEARAHGLPVIAAATGGIPDTLGEGGGILVPPGDPGALAVALENWMSQPPLRTRLRREALDGRAALPRWPDTIARVADALEAA